MTAPINFLREILAEMKQVVWPTRAEIFRLTTIVIFLSIVMGLYIGGLDYIFNQAVEALLR